MTAYTSHCPSQRDGDAGLARRVALLEAVADALGTDLDLAGLLDRILVSVLEVTGVSAGGVFLFDDRKGRLALAAQRGVSQRLIESFTANPGDYLHRLATDPGATLIVRNLDDPSGHRAVVGQEGVRAYAAIPLKARNQPLGLLVVISQSQSDFAAADVELLTTIGKQVGLAVERARLYETSERTLRRVQAFQQVATAITGSLDPRVTLERVLDEAMELFGADRAALFLVGEDGRRVHCPTSRRLSFAYVDAVVEHYNVHGWPVVFETERSIYIADAQAGHVTPALEEAIRREGFHSILFLPMSDGAERLGTLALYHDEPRHYAQQEIELARTLADQANIAIRHARLFDGERRAREQASTILDATRAVTSSLRLEDVLQAAGRSMAAALGQRVAGIWLLDDDGAALVPAFRVSKRPDPALDETFRALPAIPLSDNPRARLLLEGREPLIVERGADLSAPERAVRRLMPFDSYVAISIAAGDRVVGAATIPVMGDEGSVRSEEIEVAMAIARSTALAVENARLHEQARALASIEERNRLARDLHDSVTHGLFSMTMITQALPTLLERAPERALERIDRLNELGRGALAEMRALLFELRPAALQEHGLVVALTRHTAAFESREGVAVELIVEGERRLPAPVEECLFRVAQEALNNVAKHARASRVEVRLAIDDAAAQLTVRDDGAGFEPAALPDGRRGLGMTGMIERVAPLGGTCTIESVLGAGTTVRLSVPLA